MHCWSLLEFRKLRSVKQRFRITFTLLFISVPHSKQLFQVAAGFWIVFSGWNMTKVDHYCFFFPLLDWLLNLNHKIIIINLEIWKQNMSSNKQHFYVITFLVYYSIKLALKFCILKAHYTYMPLLFFFPTALLYSIYALEHKFYRTTLLLSCQLIIRIISLCCDAAQLGILIWFS